MKGTDISIEALKIARNNGACARLMVVGDGDDLGRLRNLAECLGLSDSVEFLGSVPDERLRSLYRQCEVFGIVFLEAIWHAKPCIGGNHGGTPEVIDHGVNGYLVEHGDTEALAKHIVEFAQKPELRKSMGLCAYEKVKANYLFNNMRDNWFTLLEGLWDHYEGSH